MTRRSLSLHLVSLLSVCLVSACGGDDTTMGDASTDGTTDSSTGDASDVGPDVPGLDGSVDPDACPAQIVANTFSTCALDCDGALTCWGSMFDRLDDYRFTPYPSATPFGPDGARWLDLSGLSLGYCAVRDDGTIWCWGDVRQHGFAEDQLAAAPVQVDPGTSWRQVAASFQGNTIGACAIDDAGALYCWPVEGGGTPTRVDTTPSRTWSDVSVSARFACAVATDETLWCWGQNSEAQLGQGAAGPDSDLPLQVAGAYTSVSLGGAGGCGLDADGFATCWGNNAIVWNAAGDATARGPVAVASEVSWRRISVQGSAFCGIDEDLTYRCTSPIIYFDPINPLDPNDPRRIFVAIDLGDRHRCLVDATGAAHCDGLNEDGQLGIGTTAHRYAPARVGDVLYTSIDANTGSTCAIAADGSSSCWGNFINSDLVQVPRALAPPEPLVDVARQTEQGICGVGASGALYCQLLRTGALDLERVGTDSDWTDVTVGRERACGLRAGQLFCWDDGTPPTQFGTDADWTEIHAADHERIFCGLRGGGELVCLENDDLRRVGAQSGLRNAVATDDLACALDAAGALYCGDASGDLTLTRIGTETWRTISGGDDRFRLFCGVLDSGAMRCFTERTASPPLIAVGTGNPPGTAGAELDATDWTAVTVGDLHVCGLRGAGELWCWGRGTQGLLGLGDAARESLAPVVSGD